MPTLASYLSSFSPHHHHLSSPNPPRLRSLSLFPLKSQFQPNHTRKLRPLLVFASSGSDSFDSFNANGKSHSTSSTKQSILSTLIQEIEPLDVSLIQKDVPPNTVDAMKRTISGMLGLLPSDQFQVFIEAFWEPLSKLLISSMMTGYTLRNAEYRLCLEKNFQIDEEGKPENSKLDTHGVLLNRGHRTSNLSGENDLLSKSERFEDDLSYEGLGIQGLGEMTPEAKQYIFHLQSRFSSVKKLLEMQKAGPMRFLAMESFPLPGQLVHKPATPSFLAYWVGDGKDSIARNLIGPTFCLSKSWLLDALDAVPNIMELREIKRKNAALQMQQFVGEEKNDLLDYLRSLQPEKVAELSEPTSPELQETIHSVIHGLLATLSPKMHSKASLLPENTSFGIGRDDDSTELVENTSIQFQPLISVTRDYLARLLFWCMLLGHYLRGLEYRLQLMELLTLSSDIGSTDTPSD